MEPLSETAEAFASLLLQVMPWFALGTASAALMETFVPAKWAARAFSGRGGLPLAISAAALLPGCSCTTMPLAAGLRGMAGPRLGTLTAFIFVSPLLSPITVALTWSLLGWQMTVGRVLAAIAGGAALGVIINHFEGRFREPRLLPIAGADPTADIACGRDDCCAPAVSDAHRTSRARRLAANAWRIARDVVPYFLLGMLVAAALVTLVPEDELAGVLGGGSGLTAFALAAIIGIPLYVCEGEEVPLTYGLLGAGLGAGPAFTFLMGSVGTCVPTVVMSRGIVGPRAAYFYSAFWILFAIAAGLAFQVAVG